MSKSSLDRLRESIEVALRQYSLETGQRLVAIDVTAKSHRIPGAIDYEVILYPSETLQPRDDG